MNMLQALEEQEKILTQAQLNAGAIITGLVDIKCVNTNPSYGNGKRTLDYVRSQINSWPYSDRKELAESLQRLMPDFLGLINENVVSES